MTANPALFARFAGSQVGHLQPMVRPGVSEAFDYAGELTVVIGTAGRHIPAGQALTHVAGYACYNEGSVRDWQRHTSQFLAGKTFAGTGAFGPWLVTADEIPEDKADDALAFLGWEVADVAVTLRILPYQAIIDDVASGNVDSGEQRIVCVAPPGDRFAKQRRLTCEDLLGETYVSYGSESAFNPWLEQAFERAGVKVATTVEVGASPSLIEVIRLGTGVGLVEEDAAREKRWLASW